MDPRPRLIAVPVTKGCVLLLTEQEFTTGIRCGRGWRRRQAMLKREATSEAACVVASGARLPGRRLTRSGDASWMCLGTRPSGPFSGGERIKTRGGLTLRCAHCKAEFQPKRARGSAPPSVGRRPRSRPARSGTGGSAVWSGLGEGSGSDSRGFRVSRSHNQPRGKRPWRQRRCR